MTVATDESFRRGVAVLQAGKFEDAERLFKTVLRAQPEHLPALNLIGIALTQLGRFAEAETYLRRALQQQAKSDTTLYNYGIVLKALDRPAEALQRFTQALALNPAAPETWNNRGTVLNDLQRHDQAIEDFDKAIALNPRYAEAHCNKGKSLTALKHWDEASSAYQQALALNPGLTEAWLGRGGVLFELKKYNESLAAYKDAVRLKPNSAEAWLGCGNAATELKRHDEASAAYEKALALKPDLAEAWLGRGNLLVAQKRYDAAIAGFDKALGLKPDLADAWASRGHALKELQRHDEAFAAYDNAIALSPRLSGAWLGRGNLYTELGRYGEASAAYDRTLAANPDLAEGWCGRGNLFVELKRCDDALAAYDKALKLAPGLAEAWLGRGNVFTELKRYDDALAAYDRALGLKPDLHQAWSGRGTVFTALERHDEALRAYDRAVALKRDFAEAWLGLGLALSEIGRREDAVAAYERALALKPKLKFAAGNRLLSKLYLCDWANFQAEFAQLVSAVRNGEPSSVPFILLATPATAADQLQCARRFVQDRPAVPQVWNGEVYAHDRIHVGYVSSDLRQHAVGQLTVGLFEHHDRSRFEVTAISLKPQQDSELGRRLAAAFERFVDCGHRSDREIADLIRQLEIDILIDLNGYTRGERMGIMAHRPAPIQAGYLGYSGTVGADFIDYIVADPTVIPASDFEFFSEKVVWLPESFMVTDATQRISERTPTRNELGLPAGAFVFCCFNQPYKISPMIFDVWMRLLRAIDGSVLWLKENGAAATRNLRREAEQRGVAPERLIFAPSVPLAANHLARQRQADLFLDTLPYNAHATTVDALWAGLPVVTCLGPTFAGRVAASLLKAAGLDDLITTSLDDYEALALKLAREPARLAAFKARLLRNRDTCSLFDTARFTRHIETAYTAMWQSKQRGSDPAHFAIRADV